MMRRIFPTVGILSLFLAVGGCDGPSERPGFIVFPGMVDSVPYDSYDPNPVTGQTLQAPPVGTIPFGTMPFTFAAGKQEALRAAAQLHNPLGGADSAKELPRGKQVFDVFCAVCHGPGGEGDGPIIGRFPNPPNLLAQHAIDMPDGQMYHVVYHGQGLMPGYAVQIQQADRWRSVLYVRWLQDMAKQDAAKPVPVTKPDEETSEEASQDVTPKVVPTTSPTTTPHGEKP